jgi:hypothetical protein
LKRTIEFDFILKVGEQNGVGKRSTLFHLMHYAYLDNWLTINIPNASSILRITKETSPSFHKENRVDTPLEANNFLKRFSIHNQKMLKALDVSAYSW